MSALQASLTPQSSPHYGSQWPRRLGWFPCCTRWWCKLLIVPMRDPLISCISLEMMPLNTSRAPKFIFIPMLVKIRGKILYSKEEQEYVQILWKTTKHRTTKGRENICNTDDRKKKCCFSVTQSSWRLMKKRQIGRWAKYVTICRRENANDQYTYNISFILPTSQININ